MARKVTKKYWNKIDWNQELYWFNNHFENKLNVIKDEFIRTKDELIKTKNELIKTNENWIKQTMSSRKQKNYSEKNKEP